MELKDGEDGVHAQVDGHKVDVPVELVMDAMLVADVQAQPAQDS